MSPRQKSLTLIVIGALFVALAGWYWSQRDSVGQPSSGESDETLVDEAEAGICGDGICQDVACLSTYCPDPETEINCPADCAVEEEITDGSNDPADDEAPVDDTPAESVASLDFSFAAQSSDELRDCPVEEANLAPSDAVNLAQAVGLSQGIQNVEVRLFRDTGSLAQCVWSVRSYSRADGGSEVVVIDSTQDVLSAVDWGSGS